MAKNKFFYYVGVQTEGGMTLVTKIDNRNRISYWDANEKPLAMPANRAEDIALGLSLNLNYAVVVKSIAEIQKQYFCVPDKEENNDNK